MPNAVYATEQGEIFDAPDYLAVGRVGGQDEVLRLQDLIPLPEGTDLLFLQGRSALAAHKECIEPIASTLYAVAAALPVGYTRTHLPAYRRRPDGPQLPLYGYTAVAMHKGRFYAAAVKTDENEKWHPHRYNTPELGNLIAKVRQDLPDNRLVDHLARCSEEWHCCTAQNLFYRRWEAGLPVSPACNANCLGCISLQPAECCPSPQSRLTFSPSVAEVTAIGCYHLTGAPDPIISFGQGCEGEPSLAADTIAAAVRAIRSATGRGVININTNAGYSQGIRAIVDAGLDSMRVSMISARPAVHQAYYRAGYSLEDVKASIAYARSRGVYVSLNMLLMPGLNDRPEETAAWLEFLKETGVALVQLRNLNIDPDDFWSAMPPEVASPQGVRMFLDRIAQECPSVELGNFSRYLADSPQG